MPSFFFRIENAYFTLSPSSSSSIHNIVIAINTPTTMNYQFEEPLKLTILSGSLLFEILGAWRRFMCAKQVSRLAVDDLQGSLLVNAETAYMEVVHLCLLKKHSRRHTTYKEVVRLTTYIEVVHVFIPRFCSNLAYLGRLPCKSLLALYILEDFGRLVGSLLGSLLKYNGLEDFQKTSRRLLGSLLVHYILEDFQEDFP
ncbi:hypothetical protein IGI04_019054 [Brassica rapa subsp. trilocularis]|uniref:Uncharacterized protein n=1 Tax=Brassica rapa subsp. trilocularis TaxID=1813537 RepID=A0ABQ7MH51_BRACM|nr:hypothetical protein IGI04_019054 [Brassica rapa subsp. trilocularis]